MLFSSFAFSIFLVVALAGGLVPFPWKLRKALLLAISYLFYMAWNPVFVVLLWLSTVADWLLANWIHRAQRSHTRRLLLLGSLAINLGLLGFFKYGGFIGENAHRALGLVGIEYSPGVWDIILPVGISFYTFQTLSYTLDVYWRKLEPSPSFLDFALFVTFFPQLVAGPIVRAADFLPQCVEPKRARLPALGWGSSLFLIGLFWKMVVADGLMAEVSDRVFDSSAQPTLAEAWAGTFAFSIQIFCDFAGYSLCAIAVAMMLGFALPDNFNSPYGARGFSDFWRRWHISLSTWMRDYLYIPLGGNRGSVLRVNSNLVLTMLISGLWHGASWLFVLWGGLHGVYLLVEKLIRRHSIAQWRFFKGHAGAILVVLITYLGVCVAWVFFRAKTLSRAGDMVAAMFGLGTHAKGIGLAHHDFRLVAVVSMGFVLAHYLFRERTLEDIYRCMHWTVRAGLLAVLFVLILIGSSGEDRAFIYFQF